MTRSTASLKLALAAGIVAATLAGCSSNNEETPIGGAPKAEAPTPAAEGKVNAPLTPEQVSVSTSVVEGPVYDAASDTLNVKVGLQNNGSVVFPVTGTNPVTLGVVQKIPGQGGQPDTRGVDTRAPFNEDIKPGATGVADVSIPASFAVGYKVEFDPLQENVVWFGFSLKQPTVVIGPFARCADGKGLCDSEGKAVAAK